MKIGVIRQSHKFDDPVKTTLLELEAKAEKPSITKPGTEHCDLFILPLSLSTSFHFKRSLPQTNVDRHAQFSVFTSTGRCNSWKLSCSNMKFQIDSYQISYANISLLGPLKSRQSNRDHSVLYRELAVEKFRTISEEYLQGKPSRRKF